jgi:3-methyl-2-oxobutanoate hydroxymethyltransferase
VARKTIADLHAMKHDKQKIVAMIVYDFQMARIADMAGADLLTIGDSLGRNVLGQADVHECSVDDMIPFAKAVVRAAEHAVVSVDMPMTPSHAGPAAVAEAARRFKELGVDMTKIDLRTKEEELFDEVRAVIDVGLGVWPQIGYPTQGPTRGVQTGPAVREHVLKWARAIEEAGGSMIDLTNVTPDIYREVSASVKLPVIGGQATPEADGKISGLSPRSENIGQAVRGRANVAQYIYDEAQALIANIRGGNY